MSTFSYEVREIGVGRSHGAPRVWLEGKRLSRAGFTVGTTYALQVGDNRVILRVADSGERMVSSHAKRGQAQPVIDVNSAKALGLFDGLDKVRVVIRQGEIHLLPLASQCKAKERIGRLARKVRLGEPLTVGSLCHGGGTTSYAMHEGMAAGGIRTRLAFANDFEPEVLFHAQEANPAWSEDTLAIAAPMQEALTDEWLLKQLGHVDILEAGVPCTAASVSGRAKKGLKMPEEDPTAGHLVVAFLGLVQALQPAVIVLENVPPYQNTASAHLIRHTLRDWGYHVAEAVLDAHDFGSVEARRRLALVATTAGLSFEFDGLAKDASRHRLAEVLEPIPPDAACWSGMDYLREKEVRDKAAGKGFRMQIVGPEVDRIGTIGADYQKNRSTEPKVRHPEKGEVLLRLLTPTEHARIKGVPDALVAGLPTTRAHHLLGNGVSVQVFKALAEAIATMLREAFAPQVASPLAASA